MYAIVEIGSKQYKVNRQDEIKVESLNKKEGSKLSISHVLLAGKGKKVYIGNPYIKKAKVSCVVTSEGKGKKEIAFKYKRRKSSKSKKGHRQKYTTLKVEDIVIED